MSTRLDKFTASYIETALWAESDPVTEEPLDKNFEPGDISPETVEKMVLDCASFQKKNRKDIQSNLTRAGYDFWLTRNRHGVGFWDGDWPKKAGDRLTAAAHKYGTFDLYVGDDGLVHGTPL